MVIPIWQPEAASTHQIAAQAGLLLAAPVTHTGTLDPLASGVVVLLSGDDRFAKGLLQWQKVYQFRILWGVATDSGDALGLITDTAESTCDELEQVLHSFPDTYAQRIPDFSARRVQGTSAFTHARAQQKITPQTRKVTISSISLDTQTYLSAATLQSEHQNRVAAVKGDFRQKEIVRSWQQLPQQEFVCTTHTVTTSPGCYIRQLTQDIARHKGVPACTWSITRKQNGPFIEKDCIELRELSDLASRN